MDGKDELNEFEIWAIDQLKECIGMNSKVDLKKPFKLELKIKFKGKKNGANVSQEFRNIKS